MENSKNRPVQNIRVGGINAAIWEQEGSKGNFMNVSFSRSYKQGNEWKTSHTYTVNQLDDLRRAATEAETYINENKRSDQQQESNALESFEARNEQDLGERGSENER
jgi:hypothetical protein